MRNPYDELVTDLSTTPQASDPKTWSQSLQETQAPEEEDPLMAILNDPAVAEALAAFDEQEEPQA